MNTYDQLESFNIPKDIKLAPLPLKARVRIFVGLAWGEYLGADTTSQSVNKRRGEVMLSLLAGSLLAIGLVSCSADETPKEACTIMIQPGDTLDTIAHGQQSLVDDLYQANGNNAAINPGDVLHLGQKACSKLEAFGEKVVIPNTLEP